MNAVFLKGRLGNDAERKERLIKFSIAVDKGFGENKTTMWVNVVTFNEKSFDFLEEYLVKGALVFIQGRIDVHEWISTEGEVRKNFGVVADHIEIPKTGGKS